MHPLGVRDQSRGLDKSSPVLLIFNQHPEVQAAAEWRRMGGGRKERETGTRQAVSEERLGKAEQEEVGTGVRAWRDKRWKVRTPTAEGTSGIGDGEAEDLPHGFWTSGQKEPQPAIYPPAPAPTHAESF